MKKINKSGFVYISAVLVVLILFLTAVTRLESGHRAEGKQQLEDVLRRTAVSCYAAEGIYPPDLDYMRDGYGIRYDEERFTVIYQPIASNLMPDITVLEQK